MTPLDLIVWAGAFSLSVIVVAIAFGIGWTIIKAARHSKTTKKGES